MRKPICVSIASILVTTTIAGCSSAPDATASATVPTEQIGDVRQADLLGDIWGVVKNAAGEVVCEGLGAAAAAAGFGETVDAIKTYVKNHNLNYGQCKCYVKNNITDSKVGDFFLDEGCFCMADDKSDDACGGPPHAGPQSYVAGGSGLYGVNPNDGRVYRYNGAVGWTLVGNPGKRFVVNDTALYGLATDGSQIWQYTGVGQNWIEISNSPSADIFAGGNALYATSPSDGSLWQYNGQAYNWSKVGLPGKQFVVNEIALYGLSSDGSQIWQYENGVWTEISNGASGAMFAGGTSLYATNPNDGSIYRYEGTPMKWTKIGAAGLDFAVSAHNVLYGLSPDAKTTWQYSAGHWNQIGGIGGKLYIEGDTLFEINPDNGDLYQYNDAPGSWTRIGLGTP